MLAEGQRLARTIDIGTCPFLGTYGVCSESEYKRRRVAEGSLMFHAQFGYRSLAKSRRAYGEIFEIVVGAITCGCRLVGKKRENLGFFTEISIAKKPIQS